MICPAGVEMGASGMASPFFRVDYPLVDSRDVAFKRLSHTPFSRYGRTKKKTADALLDPLPVGSSSSAETLPRPGTLNLLES